MPTGTARDRRPEEYTPGTAAYHDMMRRQDPNYRVPEGFAFNDRTGSVQPERAGWLQALNAASPYLIGAAGAGPLAYSAATGTGLFGGAAGAAGAGGSAMPGIATGVPAGLPGAVDLGTLGLGGGGNNILGWLKNPANWSNLLSASGDIGSVLGGASQGAAEGRHVEALLENQRDAIRNQQYGTQQGAQFDAGSLDLARKNFSEQALSNRGRQAITGNLLNNLQDVAINIPGIDNASISGGLRASSLGAGGRGAASTMAQQALMRMLQGDDFTGGEVLTPPRLSATPQASGWEQAAGIGGILGSLGGAVGSAVTQPRTPLTSTVAPKRRV